jgi:hypothetical protein
MTLPCMSRPVRLPVLLRLWRPIGPTKLTLVRQPSLMLAERFAGRQIHAMVGTGAGSSRALDPWCGRLHTSC